MGYESRHTADENFVQNRREFAELPSGTATTVSYELYLNERNLGLPDDFISPGEVAVRWVDQASGVSRLQEDHVTGWWPVTRADARDPALIP